jgi:TetR/AcrR family transcriptional regulator
VAVSRPRLRAEERRAALLDSACAVFSRGTYRGTTTAELAAAAGVTEPVLYRHFESKRALYLACLAETWGAVQVLWERALAAEPDPGLWVAAMGRAFLESEAERPVISNLWVQALAEATEDAEIAHYMRGHMSEVHDYTADVVRRAQDAGGVPADRDADAEAWIFISLGLLSMADQALGGLLADGWTGIRASRLRCLTGRT